MKNKLIIANLKTYMTAIDISQYLKQLKEVNNDNLIICPSNLYIPYFLKDFKVGAQNVLDQDLGANTGEVVAKQLNSLGIKYSIVGHSERRAYFKETNELINRKINACLKERITPILCIGETYAQYKNKETKYVLKKQIKEALKNINGEVIIAYEPIWAIGTGVVPTTDIINEVTLYIKEIVKNTYNKDVLVLYGGSVNDKNINELNTINIVDGYLIGKASTDALTLKNILEAVSKI